MDYKGSGVAELLGEWITWLVKVITEAITDRKKQLPAKAKTDFEPCTYWCCAPTHVNFNQQRNELRKKWNYCLETILKGHQE